MSGDRYVLLGLAPARSDWFAALSRWATSASIAAEFIKCVSAEEVRARLASGRRFSGLLIDAGSAGLDRDLVDEARGALTPTFVVGGNTSPPPLLGAAGWLRANFEPAELLDCLSVHCQMIGSSDRLPPSLDEPEAPVWLGQLLTVIGTGGTGASTTAIALAQGLAADARQGRRVLLADLARRADQAMLHDASDLGPGLQELVEAHRAGRLQPQEVWQLTFDVPRRGYRLLLGLRRPESWAALRPRAIDASIEALLRSFRVVVADVTGDLEGQDDGGSADVEERNHLARASVTCASVVIAVGGPGVKGTHSLAWLLRSLVTTGVSPARILPVVNCGPRNPMARSEIAKALAGLTTSDSERLPWVPLFLPERKIDGLLAGGSPLPPQLVDPLVSAVRAVIERQADSPPPGRSPTLVTPGSLGSWSETAKYPSGGDF